MQTVTTTFAIFSKHNDAAWCIGTPVFNAIADSNVNGYIMPKHASRVYEGVGPRLR